MKASASEALTATLKLRYGVHLSDVKAAADVLPLSEALQAAKPLLPCMICPSMSLFNQIIRQL